MLLFVACAPATPAPPASSATSGDETVAHAVGPIAGFVVYGVDATQILALDGTVTSASTLMVLDDRDGAVTRWDEGVLPEALHCACDHDMDCQWDGFMRVRFDRTGAVESQTAADDASCACLRTLDEVEEARLEEEARDIEESPDEYGDQTEPCPGPQTQPSWVSLAGGVLYGLGGLEDNEGCTGAHIASTFSRARPLVAGAAPFENAVHGTCFSRVLDAPGDPEQVLAEARCAAASDDDEEEDEEDEEDDDEYEDDPCRECRAQAGDEGVALYVRHGQRIAVGTNLSIFWELSWVDAQPLTAANCPGPNDPCGDPSGFPGIESYPDWWIATDGSVALVVRDGQTWIWPRGAEPMAVDAGLDVDNVLGVRFHADVSPLVRTADAEVPELEGERPECSVDEDADDDEEAADEDAPPTSVLAPEDASFTDTHGGRDWGNRCFEHLRADALDAAEAACARGVAMATEPAVLGALHYNVGRIAEARGDTAAAIASYERSLAARPGNRTVTERLDALR
jgi:hypothetical protein